MRLSLRGSLNVKGEEAAGYQEMGLREIWTGSDTASGSTAEVGSRWRLHMGILWSLQFKERKGHFNALSWLLLGVGAGRLTWDRGSFAPPTHTGSAAEVSGAGAHCCVCPWAPGTALSHPLSSRDAEEAPGEAGAGELEESPSFLSCPQEDAARSQEWRDCLHLLNNQWG